MTGGTRKRSRNGQEYVCGTCDIRFPSEDTFEEHVAYAHGTDM